MTIRTRNSLVVFHHPFELKGVDRTLPAGKYRVMTDEQLIEELSFPGLSSRLDRDLRAGAIPQ
jgi:hypothetical protein